MTSRQQPPNRFGRIIDARMMPLFCHRKGEFQRWNTYHPHAAVSIEVCGHQLNIAQRYAIYAFYAASLSLSSYIRNVFCVAKSQTHPATCWPPIGGLRYSTKALSAHALAGEKNVVSSHTSTSIGGVYCRILPTSLMTSRDCQIVVLGRWAAGYHTCRQKQ